MRFIPAQLETGFIQTNFYIRIIPNSDSFGMNQIENSI